MSCLSLWYNKCVKRLIGIRILALSIIAVLSMVSPLNAQLADHFILHGPEIEALDRFYIELGKAPPFHSRPFSNHRYCYYLRSIRPEINHLSPYNQRIFLELLHRLEREEQRYISLSPVVEGNLRLQFLSEEIPEREQYLYYRKSLQYTPLFNLGIIAGLPNFVVHAELDLRRDFFSSYRPSGYTNLPIGSPFYQEFDFNFPTRAYLSFGNRNLSLLIGRDELKWGPGYRSSVVFSDSPPYYDMILLDCFFKGFNASFFFAGLESFLTGAELDVQDRYRNTGAINYSKENTDQFKALTGHRFEFKFFNRIILGISDVLVIGGRRPELNEIHPLMFMHNIYGENYSNVMMGFDLVVVPFKGLKLYAELGVDDIRNPHEKETSPPTSLGRLAGFHYFRGLGDGSIDFKFEWALIDPWTYNRWMPYLTFSSRKKYLSLATKKNTFIDFPTGYFLGPDVHSLFFEISYEWMEKFKTKLSYELRHKGRIYLDVLDPESKYDNFIGNPSSTPTGTPVISNIFELGASFPLASFLTISSDFTLGHRVNSAHNPGDNGWFFEATVNGTVKLDRERHGFFWQK